MRFLDANVFIYAYYKAKKKLSEREKMMKESAKKIISEVSQGKEEVVTTVVQVSEIVNILKYGVSLERLTNLVMGLFMLDNIRIYGVSRDAYFAATELGGDLKLESNDALAIDIMKMNDIKEIYSFDEDFDQIEGIIRLPKLE
jgi:hypothetical protein